MLFEGRGGPGKQARWSPVGAEACGGSGGARPPSRLAAAPAAARRAAAGGWPPVDPADCARARFGPLGTFWEKQTAPPATV